MDITTENNIFVYNLIDERDKLTFSIVRMLYLPSNVPSSMFYGSVFSDFLQIARCILKLTDFVPKASQLYATTIKQGEKKDPIPSILC